MRRMMLVAIVVAAGLLGPAASARGAIAPPTKGVLGLGADLHSGIASLDGERRYLALPTAEGSLVLAIEADGGSIAAMRSAGESLVVPAVAQDASPAGLSADGTTLVLAERSFAFPQRSTTFHVFRADGLKPAKPGAITLPGTWTFDAVSPDGDKLYLIHYLSARDLSAYRVRAYDLVAGRLDPEAIVDPREAPGAMYGTALTRANGIDGRWAFTLYDSAERGHPPFIHALDTEAGTALCIDLQHLRDSQLASYRLRPSVDGGDLDVVDDHEVVASVDLESFEVTSARSAQSEASGLGWPAILIAIAALGAGGSALTVVRRRAGREA